MLKKKKKKKIKVLLIHYSTHTVYAAKYLINFYIQYILTNFDQ